MAFGRIGVAHSSLSSGGNVVFVYKLEEMIHNHPLSLVKGQPSLKTVADLKMATKFIAFVLAVATSNASPVWINGKRMT